MKTPQLLEVFAHKGRTLRAKPARRQMRLSLSVSATGNVDTSFKPTKDYVLDYMNAVAFTGTGTAVALTSFRFGFLSEKKEPVYDELIESGGDITLPIASQIVLSTPEFRDVDPLYRVLPANLEQFIRVSHVLSTLGTPYTVEVVLHVRELGVVKGNPT